MKGRDCVLKHLKELVQGKNAFTKLELFHSEQKE